MQLITGNKYHVYSSRLKMFVILVSIILSTGCTTIPKITEIPAHESHLYINPEKRMFIFRAIRQYNASDLFVTPNIPPKMQTNAQQVCVTAPEEEILAIIDVTLFGDGKNCLLIGTSGIYMNNDWAGDSPGRHFIPYEEFINMEIRHYKWYEVSIGGIDFHTSPCQMPDNTIVKLLRDVQQGLVRKDVASTGPSVDELFAAISTNNVDLVKLSLDNGADSNANRYSIRLDYKYDPDSYTFIMKEVPDPRGMTALGRAIEVKNSETVKLLLDRGANPNRELICKTYSIWVDHGATTSMINNHLRAGGTVTGKKQYSSTYFRSDIRTEDLTIFYSGVEPRVDNVEITTPLILATKENEPRIVKLLLDGGADIFLTDNKGFTALMHAQENEFTEIAEIIKGYNK